MTALWEPFGYAFMQRALLEVLLMGLACGLLGALVLLRGLTFTGESLSHALLPGAAIAVVVGAPVAGGALLSALLAAVAIAALARRAELGEDTAVGIVFSGALAVGVLVVATRATPRDLDALLFGSVLAVDPSDLWLGAAAGVLAIAVAGGLARPLVLSAFDRGWAASLGVRGGWLDAALLLALAAALTAALRGVGTLLVLALLVAPPATARLLARSVPALLVGSAGIAVLCGVVGLELSWYVDAAAGPAIALSALGAFTAVVGARALGVVR